MLCYAEVLLFGAGALVDHPSGVMAVVAVLATVLGALAAGIVVYQPRSWVPKLLLGLQAFAAVVVVYRSLENPLRLVLLGLPVATAGVVTAVSSRRYYAAEAQSVR